MCTELGLQSAYAAVLGRDPPFTAIDGTWRACVDYILVQQDAGTGPALRPLRVWSVPDLPDGALPSAEYPSDHLAIAADLAIN